MLFKTTVFAYQRTFKFYFYNFSDKTDCFRSRSDVFKLDDLDSEIDNYRCSSISRSRRAVERICKLNNWSHFVTFTFSSDFDNKLLLKKALKKIDHLLEDNIIDRYLLVPELQKSGRLHFHGFINLLRDDLMVDSGYVKIDGIERPRKFSTWYQKYRSCGFKYHTCYNFIRWDSIGYSVCYKIDQDYTDYLLKYMIKYILKDCISCYDSDRPRRYFAGGPTLNRFVDTFTSNIRTVPDFLNFYQSLDHFSLKYNPNFSISYFEISKSQINDLPRSIIEYLQKGGFLDGNSRF